MGMFDDLIPARAKPAGGMFDDLIPSAAKSGRRGDPSKRETAEQAFSRRETERAQPIVTDEAAAADMWGGTQEEWQARRDQAKIDQAKAVAESESGNVGSRRAQDFHRQTKALNEAGIKRGDLSWAATGSGIRADAEAGLGGLIQAAGELPGKVANMFTIQDAANDRTDTAVARFGETLGDMGRDRQAAVAPLMVDRPDSLLSIQGAKYVTQQGARSLPLTAAGLATSAVSPAIGLGMIGASAAGQKYGEERAAHRDAWVAAQGALVAGATEAIPEMLPAAALAGKLSKFLPKKTADFLEGSKVGKTIMTAAAEGGSEILTELGNLAYETEVEGKQYTPEQIQRRLIDSFAIGAAMGGAIGGGADIASAVSNDYIEGRDAADRAQHAGPSAFKPDAKINDALDSQWGPVGRFDAQRPQSVAAKEIAARILGSDSAPAAAQGAADADAAIEQAFAANPKPFVVPQFRGLLTTPAQETTLGPQPQAVTANVEPSAMQPARVQSEQLAASDEIDALLGIQPDRNGSFFVPGDPQAIRDQLASAGLSVRGMDRSRDGKPGVRFAPEWRNDVLTALAPKQEAAPSAPFFRGLVAPTGATNEPAVAKPAAPEVPSPPAPVADRTDAIEIPPRTFKDSAFDERKHDLLDFIALNGGINRGAAEADGVDPASWRGRQGQAQNTRFMHKPLFRAKGGMTIETLRERMADGGFMYDGDALDALHEAINGRTIRTPAGSELHLAKQQYEQEIERAHNFPDDEAASQFENVDAARQELRDDILSGMASVADASPEQRSSANSLPSDYVARIRQYRADRAAWGLNPQQEQEYQDLLELDRDTTKVGGRPIIGVRNMSAYVDALDAGKLLPVQGFTDADNFKALNDKLGHKVGDEAIAIYGKILVAEFGEGNVFHRGGDEFLFQGMDDARMHEGMARVQQKLANVELEGEDENGTLHTQRGIGASYGTGIDEQSADQQLKADKAKRKAAGLRFDREESDRRSADRRGVGARPAGEGDQAETGSSDRPQQGLSDDAGGTQDGAADSGQQGSQIGGVGSAAAELANADRGMGVGAGRGAKQVSANTHTAQSARAEIAAKFGEKFAKGLDRQKWFNLVGRIADLPATKRNAITDDGSVAGFVLDGEVWLIAENIPIGEAPGIALHEIGVHFGMEAVLGKDGFAQIRERFRKLRPGDTKAQEAYETAEKADTPAEHIDEEAIAYYVQANYDQPLARRIIDAIKAFLNRYGIPMSGITQAEVLALARGAAKSAAKGELRVGEDGQVRYSQDLFGAAPSESAQSVAQAKAKVDAKLRGDGRGYVKPSEGVGDLFGGPKQDQGEMFGKATDEFGNPAKPARQGALFSRKFPEESRLSNLPKSGASWDRIRANNPSLRGKDGPDEVTVYRATIGDEIRPDDFVAVSKATLSAELDNVRERDGAGARIIEKKVRVRDLLMGNDATEFVYSPEPVAAKYSRSNGERGEVTTGAPVRLHFARNTASSRQFAKAGYGQESEPAGEYMSVDSAPLNSNPREEWEYGEVEFSNPLVLEHDGWKGALSSQFDGKTGKALTKAVRAAGHDGIITRDKYGLSETVNIAGVKSQYPAPRYSRAIKVNGADRPTTDSTGKPIHPTEEGLRNFWNWFGDSKVVDDQGRPLVVYHGTSAEIDGFDPSKKGKATGAASAKQGYFFVEMPKVAGGYAHGGKSRLAGQDAARRTGIANAQRDYDAAMDGLDAYGSIGARFAWDENERSDPFWQKDGPRQAGAAFLAAQDKLSTAKILDGATVYPVYLKVDSPYEKDYAGETYREETYFAVLKKAKASDADGAIFRNTFDSASFIPSLDEQTTVYVAFEPEQIKSATGNNGAFNPKDSRIAYSRTPQEVRSDAVGRRNDAAIGVGVPVPTSGAIGYTPTKRAFRWEGARGKARRLRRAAQDQMIALRDAQQDVKASGGIVNDLNNVYMLENLMHGRVGDQMRQVEDSLITPLRDVMTKHGIRPAELEDYLEAKFAPQRNASVAKVSPGISDGSGMSDQAAADFLAGRDDGHRSNKKLTPARVKQLQEAETYIRGMVDAARNKLLSGGIIDAQTHAALQVQDLYVPLRHITKDGEESGDSFLPGIGGGIDVRSTGIKRALGRSTRAENILGETIGNLQRAIITTEKNRVTQGLIRLALENPNKDLWEVEKVEVERKFSKATGQSYLTAKVDAQDENTVAVFVDGKRYHIALNPKLARAMKRLSVPQIGGFLKFMAAGNRYLSAVYTSWSIKFSVVNPFRDASLGLLKAGSEKGLGIAKDAAKAWPFARAAVRADMANRANGERTMLRLVGKAKRDMYLGYAREFFKNGAATGFTSYRGIEQIQDDMHRILKRSGKGAWPTAKRVFGHVMDYVDAVNGANENAMRLAVYVAMREKGESITQSAQYAKDLTVNFNRKGEIGTQLNAFYLFYNAAIQGNHVVLKLLGNKKAVGALVAVAAAQAVLAAFGMDDRDPETGERYWDLNLSEYEKQRNFIIPMGGGKFWKLPLPYGVNVIPYMGLKAAEMAVRLMDKEDTSVADAVGDIAQATASSFMPIDVGDPISAATPSLARPIIDAFRNESWTGSKVSPDEAFDQYDSPRSSSYFPGTPEAAIQAAKALNRLGGGTDYKKPIAWVFDWSPNQLEYMLRQYTGGPGAITQGLSDAVMSALSGNMPSGQNPLNIANVLVSNPKPERAVNFAYNSRKDEYLRLVDEGKDIYENDGKRAWLEFQREHAKYLDGVRISEVRKAGQKVIEARKDDGFAEAIKDTEREVKELRRDRRNVLNDESLSYKERRAKTEKIDEGIRKLQAKALKEANRRS